LLSFYERDELKFNFRYKRDRQEYVKKTNISDYMSACLFLVKKGYGSLKEIQNLDTSPFLDCLEFEEIQNAVESHIMEEVKNA